MAPREPEPLTDLTDPRLLPFSGVVGRARDGLAVVEGAIPAIRACASELAVDVVVCTPSHVDRLRPHIPDSARWWCAPKDVLSSLLGFSFHRGVLASVQVPAAAAIDTALLREREAPLIAVAVGFTDPANVGALLRAARALGVDHVLLDAAAADPFARKAIRASAGHVFSVPLTLCADLLEQTVALRDELGADLLSLTPGGDTSLRSFQGRRARIVAFGSEGPGLPDAWLEASNARVRIPLAPEVDSLNVASAAAVTFYALDGARAPG